MNRKYLQSLFRRATTKHQSTTIPSKRRSHGFRPALEQLEERNTPSSVSLVKSIPSGDELGYREMCDVNGTLFFTTSDSVHGQELWKSDGTAAGTVLVKDIAPGTNGSYPNDLVNINGTLFFSASDGTHGWELWKSDGTEAGTVLVKDIYPGDHQSSFPFQLTNINGTLFFSAGDDTHGTELWRSDGTAGGTVMVKDIIAGEADSLPLDARCKLVDVGGTLFFIAADETHGYELWRSDGTAAGTVLVKDLSPGSADTDLSDFINVNGTLFFTAQDPSHDGQLWKSDGTEAGTVLVKDIDPGFTSAYVSELVNVNGTLFFSGNDAAHGWELWKSDGTTAGTVLVKDIHPGSGDSGPFYLTNVNGTLFFTADEGVHGTELWKSDGTTAGTVLVKDIYVGDGSSRPVSLINVNGTLAFSANDGTHGYELWRSDGTAAGTVLVKDITLGLEGSYPGRMVTINGTVFFDANYNVLLMDLWKFDPSATITVNVPVSQTYFANIQNAISGISVAGDGALQVTLSAASGTITLASTIGLTFTAGANSTANMTFTGTLAKLNAALANLKYRAGNDSVAPDMLTVTANNGTASDSQTITLTAATNAARLQVNPLATTQNDLAIYGTAGDDVIRVNPSGTLFAVTINGVAKGKFAPTGRILIFAQAGNDDIAVASSIARSCWVYGGAGNDTVVGGAAADVLLGGDGDDNLNGKGGRDLLIGGYGADLLNGDVGDDLFIGGATTFDGTATSLKSLRAEWVRTDAVYAKRVNRLRGLQSGGYNGTLRLDATTVLNDAQADTYTGGAALDCFFQALGSDTITDPNTGGTETIVLM